MLRRLTGAARVGTNGWIGHKYIDPMISQFPVTKKKTWEIHDAHAIGLANGSERAFPGPHPSDVTHKPELRALSPQRLVLPFDRQRLHQLQSPQGLLFGVGRAAAGTAADPSAGMLPARRMWKPFPALLSPTC